MLLKEVKIKNFKSIGDCEFEIKKGCKIFVGVSETGKSNLLQALSTIDSNIPLTKDLIKEGTRSTDDCYIKFIISLDKDEKKLFQEFLEKRVLSSNRNEIIKFDEEFLKLDDFVKSEYIYDIDVRKNKRELAYYLVNETEKYYINDKYVFLNGTSDNHIIIINNKTKEEIQVNEKVIINISEYAFEAPSEKIDDINVLNSFFSNICIDIIKENIPSVLLWEYKEEFLLPSTININDFVSNPNINIPLKYIFQLSGIYDIKSEYNERKEMGEASFQNLLDQISNTTNEYLKKVWKSMPNNCKLELRENAENINIRIKDTNNSYLLNKRSDGFKRLITYMIMLSVKNTNDLLNDTLLLMDEPETKIDIPGQEYLKLELINNISKNNYVFYSTHSTSMIDNNNVGRHYIVKKENECTTIEEANEDNYDDAMTLYKALGMQIYAMIKEKNIVFEGWTDAHIFKIALNKISKTQQKKFDNVGITHVPGATKFKEFASFWGLLSREYFIVSDADSTSSELKVNFENEHYDGKWYKYDELVTLPKIVTCEDFIETDYIVKKSDNYCIANNFDNHINISKLENPLISNISVIEEWIRYNEPDNKKAKKLINDFKVLMVEKIRKENIKNDYIMILRNLIKILNI